MTMQKMHFSGLESSSHLMPLCQLVPLRRGSPSNRVSGTSTGEAMAASPFSPPDFES